MDGASTEQAEARRDPVPSLRPLPNRSTRIGARLRLRLVPRARWSSMQDGVRMTSRLRGGAVQARAFVRVRPAVD